MDFYRCWHSWIVPLLLLTWSELGGDTRNLIEDNLLICSQKGRFFLWATFLHGFAPLWFEPWTFSVNCLKICGAFEWNVVELEYSGSYRFCIFMVNDALAASILITYHYSFYKWSITIINLLIWGCSVSGFGDLYRFSFWLDENWMVTRHMTYLTQICYHKKSSIIL